MTKTLQISAFLAAAAVAVGFSLTTSAPARAESLLDKCNGSSRAVVEKCCASWVQQNGRPFWMTEASATCGSSVACSSRGGPVRALEARVAVAAPKRPICVIEIPLPNGDGPTPPTVRKLRTLG